MKVLSSTLNTWKNQETRYVYNKEFPVEQFWWEWEKESADVFVSLFFSPLILCLKMKALHVASLKTLYTTEQSVAEKLWIHFNLGMYFLSHLFYFTSLFWKLFMAYFIYFTSHFTRFCFLVVTFPYSHTPIKHEHARFCLWLYIQAFCSGTDTMGMLKTYFLWVDVHMY